MRQSHNQDGIRLVAGSRIVPDGPGRAPIRFHELGECRTATERLESQRSRTGEQQCEQDLSGRCPPRESYADYQRKRKEASD